MRALKFSEDSLPQSLSHLSALPVPKDTQAALQPTSSWATLDFPSNDTLPILICVKTNSKIDNSRLICSAISISQHRESAEQKRLYENVKSSRQRNPRHKKWRSGGKKDIQERCRTHRIESTDQRLAAPS